MGLLKTGNGAAHEHKRNIGGEKMQMFLTDKEYFSVKEYADAIMEYATENAEKHIWIHAYATDEDRIHMVNAIGGFVPYKPYNSRQICDGIEYLSGYLSL